MANPSDQSATEAADDVLAGAARLPRGAHVPMSIGQMGDHATGQPEVVDGVSAVDADAFFEAWRRAGSDPNAFMLMPTVFEFIARKWAGQEVARPDRAPLAKRKQPRTWCRAAW
jgi:hypothetical protein